MAETAFNRDESYHQQVEIGAETDETKIEDLATLAVFKTEFPNAFLFEIDSKNRPFLTLNNTENGVNVVCPDGVILVNYRNQEIIDGKVDLTSIFDCKISDKVDQTRSVEVIVTLDNGREIHDTMPFIANTFENADWPYLKTIFARTEKMLKREGKFEEISSNRDYAESQIRDLAMSLAVRIA